MRTVGALLEPCRIEIEVEPTAAKFSGSAVEQMPALELASILRKTTPLKAGEKRLTERSRGQVCRESRAAAVACAELHEAACRLLARRGADHVNNPHEARGSERHGRGAPDDFDAVKVDEVDERRCLD